MGQMVMYDQQLAHHAASDFTLFTMDSVDAAFKQIHELKYHQIHRLQGMICLGGLVNCCLPSSLVTLRNASCKHEQNPTLQKCCLTCANQQAQCSSTQQRACLWKSSSRASLPSLWVRPVSARSCAGRFQGFTLTALPAGHTVGGAIWQICTPAEESIIYAPDFNHQREAHLNAGALDSCNPRPAVLICGTKASSGCMSEPGATVT